MRSPLFVLRTALRSWREIYDLEEQEGRRLTFRERRELAQKLYLSEVQKEQNTDSEPSS